MDSSPPTRPTLLVRIRDAGDQEAWGRFVDLYGPLIYGFLSKRGLQDADAADVTQDVMRQVALRNGARLKLTLNKTVKRNILLVELVNSNDCMIIELNPGYKIVEVHKAKMWKINYANCPLEL